MSLAWALAALLLVGGPATAHAQVLFAARPHPDFAVGPLLVRASVGPGVVDVPVEMAFSLAIPPTRSPAELAQDLFVLWPGSVAGPPGSEAAPGAPPGAPDPRLAREVEALGFDLLDHGRLPLVARALYRDRVETVPGGAPYVTFVHAGGPLGLTAPATWVRIPWTPRLADRTWLVALRFTARDLVKPQAAPWLERAFRGPRARLALSFHDVRPRAVFPLYFANRDRVLRLSDDPAQLVVHFAQAERLALDELFPQAASRRRSESLEDTEVVCLFLDRSAGLTPQVLTARFGYYSGLQAWAPVLVPVLFFALGNLAGPIIRALAVRAARAVAGRVHIGRHPERFARSGGVMLDRERLGRLVPGETRYADVVRICGPEGEEHVRLGEPDLRTLIYRGRRVVPHRRRTFGWLATVDRWDVEHHEVEVTLEGGVVRDVQARIRRARLARPGDAG